ncbi:hypothetical protein D1007_23668 [Hordeum vulgare]|nr:hypothetical protein D1007_23668 [Hordeum vulgare]
MDGDQSVLGVHHHHILALDHRTAAKAQLNTVARLDHYFYFYLGASCDGLLVLSRFARRVSGCCISICNPATREHASLAWPTRDFTALGMYLHRPTGEYRLLLRRGSSMGSPEEQIGCYVFTLGSDQPPRYIGWPDIASETFNLPIQLHGNLHWYAFYHLGKIKQLQGESKPIIVFDTAAESFRQMRTPIVFEMTSNSNVFEMDDGIYCNEHALQEN